MSDVPRVTVESQDTPESSESARLKNIQQQFTDLFADPTFSEGYVSQQTVEERKAVEELEKERDDRIKEYIDDYPKKLALEKVQKDPEYAENRPATVDEAKKLLKKDWGKLVEQVKNEMREGGIETVIRKEDATLERVTLSHAEWVQDVHFGISEDYESKIRNAKERLQSAQNKHWEVLMHTKDGFLEHLDNPYFQAALERWGDSPVGGKLYHAGLAHFILYRSKSEKDRFGMIEESFDVGGFVQYTQRLVEVLDDPTQLPNDRSKARRWKDSEGQELLMIALEMKSKKDEGVGKTDPKYNLISAFRSSSRRPWQIITHIPGAGQNNVDSNLDTMEFACAQAKRHNKLQGRIQELPVVDELTDDESYKDLRRYLSSASDVLFHPDDIRLRDKRAVQMLIQVIDQRCRSRFDDDEVQEEMIQHRRSKFAMQKCIEGYLNGDALAPSQDPPDFRDAVRLATVRAFCVIAGDTLLSLAEKEELGFYLLSEDNRTGVEFLMRKIAGLRHRLAWLRKHAPERARNISRQLVKDQHGVELDVERGKDGKATVDFFPVLDRSDWSFFVVSCRQEKTPLPELPKDATPRQKGKLKRLRKRGDKVPRVRVVDLDLTRYSDQADYCRNEVARVLSYERGMQAASLFEMTLSTAQVDAFQAPYMVGTVALLEQSGVFESHQVVVLKRYDSDAFDYLFYSPSRALKAGDQARRSLRARIDGVHPNLVGFGYEIVEYRNLLEQTEELEGILEGRSF